MTGTSDSVPLRAVALVGLLVVLGCSQPAAPPVASVSVDLVTEGGTLTLDDAWMAANPSSLAWGEGTAWRIGPLLGDAWSSPSSRLRVTPRTGDPVVFEAPGARRDGREPLLVVNRKGDAMVTLGDPSAGPGSFHGRGGARKRAGDSATRVLDVASIQLESGRPDAPAPASTAPGPLVIVRGEARTVLSADALAAVPEVPMKAADGAPLGISYRDLRAVSAALWGGKPVTSVGGGDHPPVPISADAWASPERVPVLRINKQGHWRFQWFSTAGAPLREDPGVRNVTRLHVAP